MLLLTSVVLPRETDRQAELFGAEFIPRNLLSDQGYGDRLYFREMSAKKNTRVTKAAAFPCRILHTHEKVQHHLCENETPYSILRLDSGARVSILLALL